RKRSLPAALPGFDLMGTHPAVWGPDHDLAPLWAEGEPVVRGGRARDRGRARGRAKPPDSEPATAPTGKQPALGPGREARTARCRDSLQVGAGPRVPDPAHV